jgi:putative phosphoesterase
MHLGLISDTHSFVHPEALVLFSNVDKIIHAGDIGNEDVIVALERLAPVHAVAGNMDGLLKARHYPEKMIIEVEGSKILLVHIPPRIQTGKSDYSPREQLGADILIHGHTHMARIETKGDILIINPGSAGNSRVTKEPSVGLLTIENGIKPKVEIINLALLDW